MTAINEGLNQARLPYLDLGDLAEGDRDILQRDINLFRILAHSPMAARRFNAVGHFIRHESKLDPRLRQLAILQVGYLSGSRYEYSHHVKVSREFGLSDEEIEAVSLDTANLPSCLDSLGRDVLLAARQMTGRSGLAEDVFKRLRDALGNRDVIDLLVTIAFYNAVVLLLDALRVDTEQDYLGYLDEFPLPAG
jgi:alkylhydroperoxidase family enzyme